MVKICRHIKTNGLRCASPAFTGHEFCYYHSKIHTVGAEPHLKYGPLQLPTSEDVASIQLSLARICDAIINDRIPLKKATALLYAVQIASQFIDRKKHFDENQTVRCAELDVTGDELAPSEFICAENEDCSHCPYAATAECTRHRHVKNQAANNGRNAHRKMHKETVKPTKPN